MDITTIVQFFKSLSFGGIVGVGLFLVLYNFYPNLFGEKLDFYSLMFLSSCIGAAIHNGIDAIIVKKILSPFYRFSTYYFNLIQLHFDHQQGIIDEKDFIEIKSQIYKEYYLAANSSPKTLSLNETENKKQLND